MNILITDDETPARGELRYILESLRPDLTIDEAKNGQEALETLAQSRFDVIFLDINMPGIDGLTAAEVIMQGQNPPLLVFATAYNQHALDAFELAAIDYIVKPFDERRIEKTLARIDKLLDQKPQLDQQLEAIRGYLAQAAGGRPEPAKLWAEKANGNRVLLNFGEIYYIEAEGKIITAHTAEGERLNVRQTLQALEKRLSDHEFVRVHKSYLVNLNAIAEVAPWFSGGQLIKLKNAAKTEIPVSRRYAAKLKGSLGW